MTVLNYTINYLSSRKFLINSLPKSGTHLLCKAVRLFPGVSSRHTHISRFTLNQLTDDVSDATTNDAVLEATAASDSASEDLIPIGIDWPATISSDELETGLAKLNRRRLNYATCHLPFHPLTDRVIQKMGLGTLLILRDPRDVVVSHAKYVSNREDHFLHSYFKTLTESEKIMVSIRGVSNVINNKGSLSLLSIHDRFRSVEPWMNKPYNYTTYFEKLVGAQGGGTVEMQRQELSNIAKHLGIAHKNADVEKVSSELFGGTVTFNKGKTGSWRNRLSEKHKQAFKEVAGQLLIDFNYERNLDW